MSDSRQGNEDGASSSGGNPTDEEILAIATDLSEVTQRFQAIQAGMMQRLTDYADRFKSAEAQMNETAQCVNNLMRDVISVNRKSNKGRVSPEKPLVSPEECRMFRQNVKVEFERVSAMCKRKAQLMANRLDEYDKRMSYLEKCADILDDINAREATKRRGDPEKPE